MIGALQDYYDFVMTHAPYFYWLPDRSQYDSEWGRGAFPAAFAIDLLYECHNDSRFEGEKTDAYNKIVDLADFILTQQCADPAKEAYGGFKSTETSTQYYSIDACRVIPGLLKAYELTGTVGYRDAAKLAGATFLYNMQHRPSELGIHDEYYGGFARAVDIDDSWLRQMDIEHLYGLIGLNMLCDYDPDNKTKCETMMADALAFYREGFEDYYLHYDPKPNGDGKWHRIGLEEEQIYDDPFSYALLGLFTFEGCSTTVDKVYEFINTISATVEYSGYNPHICWAGYIDVVTRRAACDYYDGVTSGILWAIRNNLDKPSLALSKQIIELHPENFKYWGVRFTDFTPITNQQSTVTVSWLGQLFLNYDLASSSFTRILSQCGETLELLMIVQAGEPTSYYAPIPIKGIVRNTRQDEIIIEPGYVTTDFLTVYSFIPVRHHDKIRRYGVDYEVAAVELFRFQGEPLYFKSVCRRLLG
jgi:hypothetical protein